jgi:hypothetical protein
VEGGIVGGGVGDEGVGGWWGWGLGEGGMAGKKASRMLGCPAASETIKSEHRFAGFSSAFPRGA